MSLLDDTTLTPVTFFEATTPACSSCAEIAPPSSWLAGPHFFRPRPLLPRVIGEYLVRGHLIGVSSWSPHWGESDPEIFFLLSMSASRTSRAAFSSPDQTVSLTSPAVEVASPN